MHHIPFKWYKRPWLSTLILMVGLLGLSDTAQGQANIRDSSIQLYLHKNQ